MSKTLVRCEDRMVFEINPQTWEPMTCSYYDACCFSAPDPTVTYVSYADWTKKRQVDWWRRYK